MLRHLKEKKGRKGVRIEDRHSKIDEKENSRILRTLEKNYSRKM